MDIFASKCNINSEMLNILHLSQSAVNNICRFLDDRTLLRTREVNFSATDCIHVFTNWKHVGNHCEFNYFHTIKQNIYISQISKHAKDIADVAILDGRKTNITEIMINAEVMLSLSTNFQFSRGFFSLTALYYLETVSHSTGICKHF